MATLVEPALAAQPHDPSAAQRCYVWVLSVRDGRVHALAEPRPDDDPPWGMLATRCGGRQSIGCHVTVARRGEVCTRCAAMGIAPLELLPDRADR